MERQFTLDDPSLPHNAELMTLSLRFAMSSRKRTLTVVGLGLSALLSLAAPIILRPMFVYPPPINTARWMLWSRAYKAKVAAQPDSLKGELKHIEWDGWGWAG
jgi:hypothetical protein